MLYILCNILFHIKLVFYRYEFVIKFVFVIYRCSHGGLLSVEPYLHLYLAKASFLQHMFLGMFFLSCKKASILQDMLLGMFVCFYLAKASFLQDMLLGMYVCYLVKARFFARYVTRYGFFFLLVFGVFFACSKSLVFREFSHSTSLTSV